MPDSAGRRNPALSWGVPIMMGALVIALGIAAMTATLVAGITLMQLAGGLLVAAGAVEMAGAFRTEHRGGLWTTFLAGLLSVGVGALLIARPAAGLAATTVLLGSLFAALGFFRLASSVARRYEHWGWDAAYGLASLALGVTVIASWPVSAVWLVGTLVGLELVVRGAAWIAVGAGVRRPHPRPPPAPPQPRG